MTEQTTKSGRQQIFTPLAIPPHSQGCLDRTTARKCVSDIRCRPGTLAEVAAIAPIHPLDALVAAWRDQTFQE